MKDVDKIFLISNLDKSVYDMFIRYVNNVKLGGIISNLDDYIGILKFFDELGFG